MQNIFFQICDVKNWKQKRQGKVEFSKILITTSQYSIQEQKNSSENENK